MCNCSKPKPRPRPSAANRQSFALVFPDSTPSRKYGSRLEAEAENARNGGRGIVRTIPG